MRFRHRHIAPLAPAGLLITVLISGCDYGSQAASSGSAPASGGKVDTAMWKTKWGPLSAADRELVRKVRLASLWEMPEAQAASQKAKNAKVRQISKKITNQHMYLDGQVRAVAQQLNVELPTRPTTQQQGWMDDINGRTGQAFDTTYVKWLRLAHGQIFSLIGTVRGTTQNSVMRSFADTANTYVLNHMRLLESTELTASASFPTPPPVTLPPGTK
jgi:predicted outer membrane protein